MGALNRPFKIAVLLVAIISVIPLVARVAFPSYFSPVQCVGKLPDGEIVKASGDDCHSDRFEQVGILEGVIEA